MDANVLIEQADGHISTLDGLCEQYRHTVEQDRLHLDAPAVDRRQQVRELMAPVLAYRDELAAAMKANAPVTVPDPVTDPLTLYTREHELFAMAPDARAVAFAAAIESSDRLTFDVVCGVARDKARPWLTLVPADVVERGAERWAERHHPQPAVYAHLCSAHERVEAAIRRMECALEVK
jgi:hypothetical protein